MSSAQDDSTMVHTSSAKGSGRVTTEDLSWAAGWLLAYEGEDGATAAESADSDDPFVQRARRVAAWLDTEVNRRQLEADITDIIRQGGGDPKNARHRATVRSALRAQKTDPSDSKKVRP